MDFFLVNLFMHDLTHICKGSNFYDRINKDCTFYDKGNFNSRSIDQSYFSHAYIYKGNLKLEMPQA